MELVNKLSQKQLCEAARRLGAVRLTNAGCYYYESYLSDTNKLIDRLDLDVARDRWGNYMITMWQLFYSAGVYGNTGQLHYIEYVNNSGVQCSLYVYFTNLNYNKDCYVY